MLWYAVNKNVNEKLMRSTFNNIRLLSFGPYPIGLFVGASGLPNEDLGTAISLFFFELPSSSRSTKEGLTRPSFSLKLMFTNFLIK